MKMQLHLITPETIGSFKDLASPDAKQKFECGDGASPKLMCAVCEAVSDDGVIGAPIREGEPLVYSFLCRECAHGRGLYPRN